MTAQDASLRETLGAAHPSFSVLRSFKLGAFHIGSSMTDVLLSGIWNRVMIGDHHPVPDAAQQHVGHGGADVEGAEFKGTQHAEAGVGGRWRFLTDSF